MKIVLALVGLVLFGAGVRLEVDALRYAGIGFVAAAWLTRFVRQREVRKERPGTE